ncbi:glycosyltransferase family 2 protein [Candidatus Pacearchaeota archaeon]|nr:glycosyltransferase family 2 protein [Candidatus Pacearchaeota archaeon]
MEFLTIIYFVYAFFTLYYLSLFTLLYIQNRKYFYEIPEIKKSYSISIVIPCYNEESTIGNTIKHHLKSKYRGLKKIIVVDDCSTDKSYEIAKKYEKKYPGKVLVVQTPENTGRAAGAKNYGAKFVKTDLIGFSDADSYPKPDALLYMIGHFNNPLTGGVTSRVLVKNRVGFIEKFQAIEYKVIAFTRKLFGFIDAIYVTNGPLSIYKKKVFDEVGGFSMTNWTEDIEITWHMLSKGYKISIAIPAKVYTVVPKKIKLWFKQRVRWNVGGLQTIGTYRKTLFKKGMLGAFILPFFTLSWLFAVFGFLIFIYRISRTLAIKYLSTSYSIEAQTAILSMQDISFIPSVLFFFGVLVFAGSLMYNLFALSHSKEKDFKKHGIFNLFGYMFFYLTAYPIILITSFYTIIKGKKKWN